MLKDVFLLPVFRFFSFADKNILGDAGIFVCDWLRHPADAISLARAPCFHFSGFTHIVIIIEMCTFF